MKCIPFAAVADTSTLSFTFILLATWTQCYRHHSADSFLFFFFFSLFSWSLIETGASRPYMDRYAMAYVTYTAMCRVGALVLCFRITWQPFCCWCWCMQMSAKKKHERKHKQQFYGSIYSAIVSIHGVFHVIQRPKVLIQFNLCSHSHAIKLFTS